MTAAGTLVMPGSWQLPDAYVPEMRILFQGDSITDAGRDKAAYYPNMGAGMGHGYVSQIVADLLGRYPQHKLQCYNRGISGHKVHQLAERWQIDCIGLAPDVLSILIGVNDYWHGLNGTYDGTVKNYEDDYRQLLRDTVRQLPSTRLIICEPFAVKGGRHIDERWAALSEYRAVAKAFLEEFKAAFVPFQAVFDEALSRADASYWCPDGVHPSIAGAYLMKEAWLKVFAGLYAF